MPPLQPSSTIVLQSLSTESPQISASVGATSGSLSSQSPAQLGTPSPSSSGQAGASEPPPASPPSGTPIAVGLEQPRTAASASENEAKSPCRVVRMASLREHSGTTPARRQERHGCRVG